jgi:hypothetical protein
LLKSAAKNEESQQGGHTSLRLCEQHYSVKLLGKLEKHHVLRGKKDESIAGNRKYAACRVNEHRN